MNNTIMSAKEAAAYLGISYWSILQLAKEHQIPHVRIKRRLLFRESSLLQWLNTLES